MSADITEMDPRTARSKTMQQLREGPRTAEELTSKATTAQRVYVRRVRVPRSAVPNTSGVKISAPRTVYYLWGDERRAVRKLMDVQPKVFERAFSDGGKSNILTSAWEAEMVQLAREEWDMQQYQPTTAAGGGDD